MDIDVNKFITHLYVGLGVAIVALVALGVIEVRSGVRLRRLNGRSLLVLSALFVWGWFGIAPHGAEIFLSFAVVTALGGLYWLNADRRARATDKS